MPDGVLIIGYGNTLRGDDAAGPVAARALAERGCHTLAVHQLIPELAEAISTARTVIFLDAQADIPPGEVRVQEVFAAQPEAAFEHQASPAGLLYLARLAYGRSPQAWLVAMGGASFEFGAPLSDAGERAISRALQVISSPNLRPSRSA